MNKRAFSLIELSIVLLVIGVIIAVITESSTLISSYRLKVAQNLTRSSPVNAMQNLVIWYEPTLPESIVYSEAEDMQTVSVWYNISSSNMYPQNYNATQGSDSLRPLYIVDCVNHLPCLRFDGIDDYMPFDGNDVVYSDYTVVAVERRRAESFDRGGENRGYYIGGSSNNWEENLYLGYYFGEAAWDQWDGGSVYPTETFKLAPSLNIFILDVGSSRKYYRNGELLTAISGGTTNPVKAFEGAALGRADPEVTDWFYDGDICEIMIFNRVLKNAERLAIQKYLSKKWGVDLVS